jgi:hypothetical protein
MSNIVSFSVCQLTNNSYSIGITRIYPENPCYGTCGYTISADKVPDLLHDIADEITKIRNTRDDYRQLKLKFD